MLDRLRERADRRAPVTEAIAANFERGKRGETLAPRYVFEVVAHVLGKPPTEWDGPSGPIRRHHPHVCAIARAELARQFGIQPPGRGGDLALLHGFRWKADAPMRAEIQRTVDQADARRYGLRWEASDGGPK